ncbi:MAG: serine protease [Desulfobaccales bacterium]|nr:serine protease [Desulfobaccales bacterium]
MDVTAWAKALETLQAYSFKISTPSSSGTGFLIKCGITNNIYGVATAYHVIEHAHQWEEPIKLLHTASGKQVVIRHPDPFIFHKPLQDVAIILFFNKELALPEEELNLVPEDKSIKAGIPIGWVGYPAVAPNNFSFFTGAVSCFLQDQLAYLVDGVAINGVSGGPAFTVTDDGTPLIMGVVTAYIPNRATGESLPGVCFVASIHRFYDFIKEIKSVEEAREKAKEIEKETSASAEEGSPGGPTAAR